MKKKIQSFQGLRAVAILLIFLSHAFPRVHRWGGCGVSFFIVMSGFLYEMRDPSAPSAASLMKGLLRKAQKLWPLHFVTFLFSLKFAQDFLQTAGMKKFLGTAVINLAMIQSWFTDSDIYFSFNLVSWYLTLVFFFALLSPFLHKLIVKIKHPELLIACGVIADILICAVSLRTVPGKLHWFVYISPIARLVDYVIGMAAFRLAEKYKHCGRLLIPGYILLIIMLVLCFRVDNEYQTVAAWICSSVFIITGLYSTERNGQTSKLLGSRTAVWIGNLSMEIFLMHRLVLQYLSYYAAKFGWTSWYGARKNAVTAFIVTVCFSVIWQKCQSSLKSTKKTAT